MAAVVNRIDVTGNERVEDETVRAYMTIQPRRAYSAQDVDDSLRALYATGLFSDVAINQRGAVLVVSVTENALIYKVSFEGNDKYDDKMLLTQVKSKPRTVLSRAKVEADTQLLLELYRRKGRYRATVEPKIIKLPQNRVNLVFEIAEGDKTGVARINFIGNHAFSDSRLRDVIKTRESGLLSFIRSTDSYDPSRLESDQEALREYYLRHGYADFRIISAVADLDRERNTFFVTFTVEEGEQYTIGEVNVQSSLASVGPEELAGAVRTDPGDTYDSREVDKTLEEMVLEVSERGYAFAEVNPRGERDYENHTINITYHVDEGPRVYIERIDIRGNTRTRDYVIRRELDFAEGDAFNRVLINKAKRRLKNLGFFKDVAIATQRGSSADRVIIIVNVEEQATGELSFGAGYSSAEGVIGDVSITERNFLGRGQFVRAAVGGGESTRTYEFSFREPYFMGRRLSAGFDLYRRQFEETDYRSYEETTTGGNLTFGLPLNEEVRLNLTYTAYQRDFDVAKELKDGCYMRKYTRGDKIPPSCDRNGDGKFDRNLDMDEASLAVKDAIGETFTSIIGYSLVYDTRDDIKRPRDGYYGKFQQEFAGVGGDVAFIRTTVEGRAYREIWADRGIVGMFKVKAGHVESLDDRLKLPDHFFLGGETIRGFGTKGIGPRDGLTRDALGGRYYVAGTAEATFPLPAVPSEIGLEGAVFTDAGTLLDVDDSANFFRRINVVGDNGDLRWAAGFGIIWHSPFGPIRADFAWPIVKNKYDETQVFRIGGGTQF
ncbi:outer membrane protein assembly factor BamA [Rhodobium gokarnense]|uniref:Outer membrane protein assembly factor BamA n=1 Tax=Rhodobium gokarnense TaxID=364296 RepID=A0ABT3HB41_9HYPH|nr:outer membrane protein assembly factor BamA [Rhodobium gokarnense]MCW2307607.1 outer membrane protein insertion porin family [Rhodobium gokarnense]